MGKRGRAKDVPSGAGGSDPGQVPGQERYGESPDDEEGVGGKQVDDQAAQEPM